MGMLRDLAIWLQNTGLFVFLREGWYGQWYAVILSLHLTFIALFGAMILLTDLRLLGVAMTSYPVASIGIGIAVFVIWVAPDALLGYRHHWLFENPVTGSAASTLSPWLKRNINFILLRTVSSTVLIPVVEELFWRGWMMRWLIHKEFLRVPIGKYAPSAFWIVAVLFASEHGPYWEVGLAAGIVYNWWIIRTRNLADCIVAHAVTNGLLSVYVLAKDQWQYWL